MAGPTAKILLPTATGDHLIRPVIAQVSANVDGNDFWVIDTTEIGGTYKGRLDMGPKTRILCDRLRKTADLLRRVGEHDWCEWLEESLRRIENSDLSGIEHLRGAYGGMGSFNDLVISPVNGHLVSAEDSWGLNARLDELRHEMYELAD